MAVQTSFVTCAVGRWVQLCQQRDERTALMVQLIGGVAILGINTNAPIVSTAFGNVPCGIFHSIDSGMGPNTFEVCLTNEGDITTQQWSAYVVTANFQGVMTATVNPALGTGNWAAAVVTWKPAVLGVQAGPVSAIATNNNNTFGGGGPVTTLVPFTASLGVLVAGVLAAVDSATPPTASSGLIGAIPATAQPVTPANFGNVGYFQIFTWNHPGGADTITFATAAEGFLGATIFTVAGAGVIDQTGAANGTGNPVSVATAGATVEDGEVAFAGFVSFCPQIATNNWILPFAFVGGFNVFFGIGNTWAGQFAWATNAGQPPIITVIEAFTVPAFDDPDFHDPHDSTFAVQLPRLSDKGITALHDLMAKIDAKEASNAQADAAEHD